MKVLRSKNLNNIKEKGLKMLKPNILCIIPARAGSVGLPNKNIRKLAGKPLIQWTLDQAIDSKLISKIVVSTDSDQVIKICKKIFKKLMFPLKDQRTYHYNSLISKVIIHTLNYYKKLKEEFDYIILLEPTSPIRFKNDR